MSVEVTPKVYVVSREEWGANPKYPQRGHQVPQTNWKHTTFHHTVIVDNDATPNLWETRAEVYQKMRQLQIIRPDLGNDVPYSWVIFLMADNTIIVCEGRGLTHTGAHTIGHNSDSQGIAFEGDFENFEINIRPWIPQVNSFLGWLKFTAPCPNITARPHPLPTAQTVYYHSMFSTTACPGSAIKRNINAFRYIENQEEEDTLSSEEFNNLATMIEVINKKQQKELDLYGGQIKYLIAVINNDRKRLATVETKLEKVSETLDKVDAGIREIVIPLIQLLVEQSEGHVQIHNSTGGAQDTRSPVVLEKMSKIVGKVEIPKEETRGPATREEMEKDES